MTVYHARSQLSIMPQRLIPLCREKDRQGLTYIFIHVECFYILERDFSILVVLDQFLVTSQGGASWTEAKVYKAKVDSFQKWEILYIYSSRFQRKLLHFFTLLDVCDGCTGSFQYKVNMQTCYLTIIMRFSKLKHLAGSCRSTPQSYIFLFNRACAPVSTF